MKGWKGGSKLLTKRGLVVLGLNKRHLIPFMAFYIQLFILRLEYGPILRLEYGPKILSL